MQDLIKKYIHKIDNINNNTNIKNKRKKILENKYNTKMNNKIDDLQWKINYFTNNFGNIIIGNLSTFQKSKIGSSLCELPILLF